MKTDEVMQRIAAALGEPPEGVTVDSIEYDFLHRSTLVRTRHAQGTVMSKPLRALLVEIHEEMRAIYPVDSYAAVRLGRLADFAEKAMDAASKDERWTEMQISDQVRRELDGLNAMRLRAFRAEGGESALRQRIRSLVATRAMRINPADPRKAP